MADPRVSNLAQILVNYSIEVKEKDLVGIIAQPPATPLVREVVREVLRKGGYPYLMPYTMPLPVLGYEGVDQVFFEEASEDQLRHLNVFYKTHIEDFDGRIFIHSQYNTRSLTGIDPQKVRIYKQAYKGVFDTYFERMGSGSLRRVSTLFPTQAFAQDADMSLKEFEDYVYNTTFSDQNDPLKEWQRIHDQQQKIVDWLKGKKEIQVKGPNADLTLSVEGRPFINSDGKQNMPSGEIFTGPVENSAEGWVRFSYPAIKDGYEVEEVELHFEKGRVVKASATKNEEYLITMLDTDKGSRYLGEFAIGTNEKINRFIKKILFDEKIGGTMHMAIGQGYPITGSVNSSAIHWDFICDMRDGGQIFADGKLFYESGEFKI